MVTECSVASWKPNIIYHLSRHHSLASHAMARRSHITRKYGNASASRCNISRILRTKIENEVAKTTVGEEQPGSTTLSDANRKGIFLFFRSRYAISMSGWRLGSHGRLFARRASSSLIRKNVFSPLLTSLHVLALETSYHPDSPFVHNTIIDLYCPYT